MALKHIIRPIGLKLKNKEEIAKEIYSFHFVPKKSISWKAGQYGILEIKLPSGRTARKTFSIASAPHEHVLTITTRIKQDCKDTFKNNLLNLKKGDEAKMRGPVGPMHIKGSKSYAFLANGIGITPFRAILKQLASEEKDNKIILFYVGNKEAHYFKEELNEAKSKLKNCQIIYIYKPERITGQIIEDTLGTDIADTVFFLSGSPKLVKSYNRTLRGLGVPWSHIKRNPFWGQGKNLRIS